MRIISGTYKGRRFDLPKNLRARPTTDFARENLFNVLSNQIDFDGISALDLFSGTGAISIELASRGAQRVIGVEIDRYHVDFIRKTLHMLKEESVLVINGDVFKYIKSTADTFDFIFADPPYDLKTLETIPELVLGNKILKSDGLFVLVHSKKNDFSQIKGFLEKRVYGSVNFSFFTARD
ncbi:RsmD family RNA methyltransferase [Porphyromonadaceae bacterium]